jgi:hypothetical protein
MTALTGEDMRKRCGCSLPLNALFDGEGSCFQACMCASQIVPIESVPAHAVGVTHASGTP